MDDSLNIVAKVLSVLLYPLFIPTYGVAIFCMAYSLHVIPLAPVWQVIAICGTLLLTCIIPVTAIWILMKKGEVTDLQIADAHERKMPFLYTVLGFCFWCYLLIAILHVPLSIAFVAVGATTAIAFVALINYFWKISAHLTGFGGLVGGIFSYCLGLGAIPTWGLLTALLVLSLALMYARLRLDAHTPAQVCTGWLLGLSCTFIPFCIYCYVA